MRILAIDTSAEQIGLGYYDGNYHVKIVTTDPKSHNKTLLSEIDAILNEQNVTLADIDYYAVVIGPGSFTGIRIGVATINAFAMANKKPVIEVTAQEQLFDGSDKMVLLDCKHGNYYVGISKGGQVFYDCMKKDEADSYDLPEEFLNGVYPGKLLACAVKKVEKGNISKRARPFYIKRSSAETGE